MSSGERFKSKENKAGFCVTVLGVYCYKIFSVGGALENLSVSKSPSTLVPL